MSFNEFLLFIDSKGVYIGEAVTLLFFLIEAFLELGRTEKKSGVENLKTGLLFIGAAASVFFAFWSLQKNYEPMSPATVSYNTINNYYKECVHRVRTLPVGDQRIIAGDRLAHVPPQSVQGAIPAIVQSDCLALAMRQQRPTGPSQTQIQSMSQDIALGARLLQNPKSEGTIGNTLRIAYGINADDFLGTGRSLPIPRDDDSGSRYSRAAIREYWAPNVCAVSTINPQVCPQRTRRAWGWRFSDLDTVNGKTVRDVILSMKPDEGGDTPEFAELQARVSQSGNLEDPTPLLVRFQVFDGSHYLGTVGRPEANQVFFSSLADVIDLPVRDAYNRSGADNASSLRNNDVAFIWVYQPQTDRDYRMATWGNLFTFLQHVDVDSRIQTIADDDNWRPAQHN